jgi:hypothetical protein
MLSSKKLNELTQALVPCGVQAHCTFERRACVRTPVAQTSEKGPGIVATLMRRTFGYVKPDCLRDPVLSLTQQQLVTPNASANSDAAMLVHPWVAYQHAHFE